jgi:hypothetical protein
MAALYAAGGGTVCANGRMLLCDRFYEVLRQFREHTSTELLIVYSRSYYGDIADASTMLSIDIPPLAARRAELTELIEWYANDALAILRAHEPSNTRFADLRLTDSDRDWVMKHSAATIPEIEKGTLRMLAMRSSDSVTEAAPRAGLSVGALQIWTARRRGNKRVTGTR